MTAKESKQIESLRVASAVYCTTLAINAGIAVMAVLRALGVL